MATKTADDPKASAGEAPTGKRGINKMMIIGIVIAVLVIEIGVLCVFFLPSKTPTGPASTDPEVPVKKAADDSPDEAVAESAEVPIGTGFRCTNSKAAAGAVVHVDFKLVALIPVNQKSTFEEKVKQHDARIRQAIIKVARSSSLDDLNDPNLSTMKRLVREEINKILRKSYVTEVVISDFTTMEQ
jgi:flagellar basal body-associated protein FliL